MNDDRDPEDRSEEPLEDRVDETERYRKEVVTELAAREKRLTDLDQKIQALEFELEQSSRRKHLIRGDARMISMSGSLGRKLREEIKKKESLRKAVVKEVEQARERLAAVDDRLRELGELIAEESV